MEEAAVEEVGRVSGWVAARGFGFITSAGQRSKDVFFVATAARTQPGEYITFKVGDAVAFTRGTGRDGRELAVKVRKIGGGDE